jgi:hypothetical protein
MSRGSLSLRDTHGTDRGMELRLSSSLERLPIPLHFISLSVGSDDRLFDYVLDFAGCPDRWILAKLVRITTRHQWGNEEEIPTISKSGLVSFANSEAQRPLRLEPGEVLRHPES